MLFIKENIPHHIKQIVKKKKMKNTNDIETIKNYIISIIDELSDNHEEKLYLSSNETSIDISIGDMYIGTLTTLENLDELTYTMYEMTLSKADKSSVVYTSALFETLAVVEDITNIMIIIFNDIVSICPVNFVKEFKK
jgi:hypothetical protein